MLAGEGTSRLELGREAFLARVWAWQRQYGATITGQLRRLGASCDWSRERFTLDPGLSSSVLAAFTRLHSKGLVYRSTYMVNWAPQLQTAVSDLEVKGGACLAHRSLPIYNCRPRCQTWRQAMHISFISRSLYIAMLYQSVTLIGAALGIISWD